VEIQAYNNAAYLPDTRSGAETIEVNEGAIVRAAHMSMDSNLLDRRFRDLNAFQQYPAPLTMQAHLQMDPEKSKTTSLSGDNGRALAQNQYKSIPGLRTCIFFR